jgi:3-oxoacyl-ACP reductase-like protein
VYNIKDVDAVLEYVTTEIVAALNIVAPEKEIRVKKGPNLFLARNMLEKMKRRDAASGKRYRILRNKVTHLLGGTSRIATSRPSKRQTMIAKSRISPSLYRTRREFQKQSRASTIPRRWGTMGSQRSF